MKEKILIIEDDFTIQTQLKTLLSGNGYEVFAVTDFSQTIEQLKEAAPHLVILDIKLPGNNGFEICSQIRTFSAIPILFVTSSNTDMDELNSIMPVSYTHLFFNVINDILMPPFQSHIKRLRYKFYKAIRRICSQ